MWDYYWVKETIAGKKQELVIWDRLELEERIAMLSSENHTNNYKMITDKKGWYRISYTAIDYIEYQKITT
jgi:hypothetical protein